MKFKKILVLFAMLPVMAVSMASDLKIASVFTDHMVLQRNSKVAVWGSAKPGDKVTVSTSWGAGTKTTKVNADGRWRVEIPTSDNRNAQSLTVSSNGEKVKFNDILFGEVWLLGGQSNMSMPLSGYNNQPVENSTESILASGKRKIRFITVPNLASYRPLDYIETQGWTVASPATAGECSAVGWFFAETLEDALDVPIGLINVSFSGSNLESWMSPEACAKFPNLSVPPLSDETSPWIGNVATLLYNGMMHPVIGYGIAGMLFYQGESNIFDVPAYSPMLAATVSDLRDKWGKGNWPFYITQIAPYDYSEWNFFTPQWPEISAYMREAQLKSSNEIPNSGLAVTLDVGEDYIIHPPKKKPVGQRLAMLALTKDYGFNGFEFQSPEYDHMEVKDGKAILHFKNVHKGITSYGKKLQQFEIAGDNHIFVKADASINDGDGTVIVSSRLVSDPKAVRYAFRDYTKAELFGTGGHPISSFRTDNW